MKKIFESLELKNLRVKNRLVRSATWEGIANLDGSITDESYKIYSELAHGGVGAIITGFTSVMANDYYFGGMMRLCDDSLIPQYKKLADIIHAENCPVISQIALGAYYRKNIQVEPDKMTLDEIKFVIQEFINAAIRADKAGFDGVQIHAAHFFFLSRFISPLVNHRNDSYGGSTENRVKILLDIMHGIRQAASNLHITIKINSSDFIRGGLNESESLEICKLLDESGIDSIEVSGNGTSVAGIKAHVNEGYFVPFAEKVADLVSCPVIVVGGLRSFDTMQEIINQSKIALISLSRPLLCEPDLPDKMRLDSNIISKCISCNRCYSSRSHKCVFRGE
ncbi:MAG: NADH:flavin oxidoreductase [Synergistaceae bacterium]|nr:NADH:flavin oxidoreductase [Synergistaceae bacterium]